MSPLQTDVLVIGCGIASASAALRLAQDHERQITVVTRAADPQESNTYYAQGGIVALGKEDSADLLVEDILAAGAGLSLPSAARILAEEGPRLVRQVLIETTGISFDRTSDGRQDFGREGAHSRYLAGATVLATGGLGRIYRHTSNPKGARGDGLAMAYRAGGRVINTEYLQFHPTVLAVANGEGFLVSEAVRGEGGRLLTPDGRPFMADYAPRWRDLAPRDVVARAIHHEMIEHGYPHVLLDIHSAMSPNRIQARFPTIYARCKDLGIDITRQPIPVVPATHYFCGGVWTDAWGCTTVRNLYAIGEVACTGVHGANRLASTSLLEGLVWGNRAARDIAAGSPLSIVGPDDVPCWEEEGLEEEADPALIRRDMRTIQHTM